MRHSMPIIVGAISALAITACAPDGAPQNGNTLPATTSPAALPQLYNAVGTEPFWSLTIDDGTVSFQPMEGEKSVAQNTTARPSINGWRYTSDTVSVDVTFSQCSDGMSDVVYKDTVTVLVGTTEYRGCGGGALPVASLVGTSWRFVELNGAPVTWQGEANDRSGPGLVFARNTIGVSGGCNGGGATYVSGDGWLRTGPITATEMACDSMIMAQESAAFALVGNAVWSLDGEGYLVLKSATAKGRLRPTAYDPVSTEPHIAPKWELRRWNVASLNEQYAPFSAYGQTPFMVSFADGRLSAKVGCNQQTGAYSIDGDVLVVGPMSATRMACAPELMARDRQFAQLMQSRPKFAMSPNRELLIGSKDGVMVLQGSRTADEPEK